MTLKFDKNKNIKYAILTLNFDIFHNGYQCINLRALYKNWNFQVGYKHLNLYNLGIYYIFRYIYIYMLSDILGNFLKFIIKSNIY